MVVMTSSANCLIPLIGHHRLIILILTGDLTDRGPKIKETLTFVMNTPSVYSLMSNHEWKLLRYIRGHLVQTSALVKTIDQCGEPFLRDPSLLKWLESLPWIVRYADTSYVVHAGIRPDRPINRQEKDHCIYIRKWNPKTRKFLMKARIRGGMNILISTHHRGIILHLQ
jgi:hypothetical protein